MAWAEAVKVRIAKLEAEVDAAKRREAEAVASQGMVVQVVVEKVLRSGRFSALANELASILNTSVREATLDAVAQDHPDLDKFKYGYEVVSRDDLLEDYATAIVKYARSFLVMEALASAGTLLTVEVVLACSADEDPVLEGVIADLGKDNGVESEAEQTEAEKNVEVE